MKNLHWYDYLTINLFWLGLNIRNNALGVIFMPYLVDLFVSPEIKNTALGEMRTAGLVIAMLVQPAMGLWSDRCRSPWGRRRPFIFVGTLFDILFLSLVAVSTGYWMLLVVVMLFQVSANASHGALQGLIPDLVPEHQRGLASGVKAIMELLPLILLSFTVAKWVGAGQFGWAVAATCLGLLLIMLLTLVLVKEQPLQTRPTTPFLPTLLQVGGILAGILVGAAAGLLAGGIVGGLGWVATFPWLGSQGARAVGIGLGGTAAMGVAVVAGVWSGTFATLGRQVFRQPAFSWWVVNRLMFLTAITSIQGFAPFFLMYAFHVNREQGAAMTGNLMMVVGVFTLLSALPGGWLSDRLGHQRLVALSGSVAVVGTLLLLGTIWLPNLTLIYIAGIILGLATGLFVTTNWALGTRLAPPEEAGRYLGVSNLAGAGAGMIGAGIGGPMADALEQVLPGLGYFVIFAAYGVLFLLSVGVVKRAATP